MLFNDDTRLWGLHSQIDSRILKDGFIALGWPKMGNLSLLEKSRDAFKEKFNTVYPNSKKGTVSSGVGMLFRFTYEVQIGDYVIFPSKADRMVNIGIIESDYYFDENESEYVQQRKVKWIKQLPRTSFTQGALHEIGSAMSFFSVKNYADEFISTLNKSSKSMELTIEDEEGVAETAEEIVESTKDFILKELSRHLKGYELEEFIANLLNTMGYRTILSARGGDSGIDITAYKDELPPRILVQVKSQDGDIKETTIQSLKGAMREGDYGLFVTLSNYTKKARKYLEDTPIIRGINGNELVDLILKNYEGLDERYKKLIPLKMVYIPVSNLD